MCYGLHAHLHGLAQHTVLSILVVLLGNGIIDRHHLLHGGDTGVGFFLLSGLFTIGRKRLLDLLKGTLELQDTLLDSELLLGLPGPGTHL